MAEARSAVSEHRYEPLEEGRYVGIDFIRAWRKAILRRFFYTRNQVYNGLWPTSIYNLIVTVCGLSILLLGNWSWAKPITASLWAIEHSLHIHHSVPYHLRAFLVSSIGGVAFFILLMYMRRWLKRILLSYRGWMYEPPKKLSWKTKIWGVLIKLVSGYHPVTFSYQNSLPCLPVPRLQDTVSKFLTSVKPLYGEHSQEYQRFQRQAKEFEEGVGRKLQWTIVLKSWWAQNWVTDWWETYVYLRTRSPLPINSNYYALDNAEWIPTPNQTSRAASIMTQLMHIKKSIDRQELAPQVIRGTIPLCMAQYERLFSLTRVPGEDGDTLVKYDSHVSQHAVVMRKGVYYKVSMYDKWGRPITAHSLEQQLQWIIEDADKHTESYSEVERSVCALTGGGRSEWARARTQYFKSGVNKETLDILESAIFHLILETWSPSNWSDQGKFGLHGNGNTFWFDKSFQICVFPNGRYVTNAEHSWGDAPVIGHMEELNYVHEATHPFDDEGFCVPTKGVKQGPLHPPTRHVWEVPTGLKVEIERAFTLNKKNNAGVELQVIMFDSYGKGFMKKCKVSPDGYIQMALQLAYFKDAGRFALTYESSMTRLYLLGRTETVRSLTPQSRDFVQALMDPTQSREERIRRLRVATDNHQLQYKDAMCGKGIDRHLFGLYVACKGLGYESDFLQHAISIPWTLSTSQQPQQQVAGPHDPDSPEYYDKVCPGGGFGPVSDDGYGVSYMVCGDNRIFFHVSAKTAAPATDARRFVQHIRDSMQAMRELLDPSPPKHKPAPSTNGQAAANNNQQAASKMAPNNNVLQEASK